VGKPTVLAAAALALALSAPGIGAAADHSGVKGRVFDATCFGPCDPAPGVHKPYAGEAKIVAKRISTGRRAGADAVQDGRFRIQLGPGDYRLRVKIDDPCWSDASRRVEVAVGEFRRVTFEVANICVD
jgi:hypothetical protein